MASSIRSSSNNNSKRRRTAPISPPEQISSAAKQIAGNDDILTEILLRLPAKSLFRFKSVSKAWLSLISDPHFTLHWRPTRPVSGLFLRRYSRPKNPNFKLEYIPLDHSNTRSKSPLRSLSFVKDPLGIKILQSCHGLLFCSSCVDHRSRNYYIYNPTSNQFRTLPRPNKTVLGINLAFDPSKSLIYKVICVCSQLTGGFVIEIYSPETGTWRSSGNPFKPPIDVSFRRGVFWNGAIHWPSCWLETSLYYDIDNELLQTMPMPPIKGGQAVRTIRFFGESRGHLHLIDFFGFFTTQFDVFEMETDYSKWLVKYRVDLDVVVTAFPEIFQNSPDPVLHMHHCIFSVLCLVRAEIEDESSLVLYIPGKAISYNFKDKTFEQVCDLVLRQSDVDCLQWDRWLYVHPYIQSLFCV